jgi:hypothetical protein
VALSAVGFLVLLTAQSPTQTLPWNQALPPEGEFRGDELVVRGERGRSVLLLSLFDPKLPSHRFVLKTSATGDLEAPAVLEMVLLRHTDDKVAERFVRTVDTGGPMAKLSGEFTGREIELPCVSDPQNPPKAIRVSIRFDGPGEVRFQPFRIEPWARGSLTWMASGGAAMIFGVALGAVGGAYAIMAAVPSFREAALRIGRLLAALGVVMMVLAYALYLRSWPFGIWMTVGVGGAISALGFGGTLPLVRRALAETDRLRVESDGATERV